MTQEMRGNGQLVVEDEWANATRFPVEPLKAFVERIFRAAGLSETRASTAAESTLIADLRGIDSHGLARLPYQANRLRDGLVDPDANLTVLRETAATLALDAHNGSGLVLAPEAMARCITKAEDAGFCMTTVRASNHFGIAGYYALMAAQQGLCGIAMTNSSPLVVPTFGTKPMLGSNPLAVAVPTGDGPPLVLDMSTSTVAWGKIEIYRRAGKQLPAGWALDEHLLPTTDPVAARWLTPLGGDRETGGQKGYGLSIVVDILCGPLASGVWSANISGATGGRHVAGTGHTFMAWRIDAFRDPADFYADVQELLADLRACPPAAGCEQTGVMVPGDPEAASVATNQRLGIPIKSRVLAELRDLAAQLGVPFTLDQRGEPAAV
jgi:LDH2 family malate/lactate/ureidoglycolate dehydrogenase